MTAISNILVGVDGREPAWDGLALARRLAHVSGGRLIVVCAYPPAGYSHTSLLFNGMHDDNDAQRALRAARDRLAAQDAVDYLAVSGAMPGQCLHDVAVERNADLLVLGGAEHGAVGRVLGGSVLSSVLVDPPCPVVAAPRGRTNGSRRIRRIGVAVDGSSESVAALRWATRLAEFHTEICELRLLTAHGHAGARDHSRVMSTVLASATRTRDRAPARPEVRWTQAPGPAAGRLVDLSAGLDLLVVGTHGRRRLSRLLHGSVSSDLARSAHCPVVAVPLMTRRA